MIYEKIKVIGRVLIDYSPYGTIVAVSLSILNSFFVDYEAGSFSLKLAKSAPAVVNYGLLVIVVIFLIAERYGAGRKIVQEAAKKRILLDNFCEQVFTALKLDHRYRVSVFEESGGKLRVTGRFAEAKCDPTTKVEFESNMGCVGIVYYLGSMLVIDNLPDFKVAPQDYYAMMKEKGNMDRANVDRLNRKHRSYLSFPIKYFNSRKTAAVLCIDCSDPNVFTANANLIDSINEMISPLISTFFMNSTNDVT